MNMNTLTDSIMLHDPDKLADIKIAYLKSDHVRMCHYRNYFWDAKCSQTMTIHIEHKK